MTTPARIALYCLSHELLQTSQALSNQFSLPLCHTDSAGFDYLLVIDTWPSPPGYRCMIKKTGKAAPGAVWVDFCSGQAAHRRQYGGGRKQTLARAIGLKPGFNPHVLDLTAGMGKDAFVLASLGCQVTLMERKPAIFLLLNNGIERALHDEQVATIASRMTLHFTDSNKVLDDKPEADVVYLDPMYPARLKSALVKKEMRYFHDIAGQDEDAANILQHAMHKQFKRIVVKRPINAEPLANLKPDTIISSKNTRYDIYLHNPTKGSR